MEPARIDPDFAQVLRGVLGLPPNDQARLSAVLQRLTSQPATGQLHDVQCEQATGDAPDVQAWLQHIEHEAPWARLILIEDAIEDAFGSDDAKALGTARAELLRAHPPLAVRRAVVQLASHNPVGACIGGLGLLVALFGVGRMLFRLVF